MDKITQLMVITMEECGELIQVCSKLLRKRAMQGHIPDLALEKLTSEAADVRAMIYLLHKHGLITTEGIESGMNSKLEKLKTWSELVE
tara:strand:+ start:231 stop:494 length:264 start_codon:yes stop_codon:yes gene_type:complete